MSSRGEPSPVHFTITRGDPNGGSGTVKAFTLKLGADTPVRIGRSPACDIVVKSRAVSQYHVELRVAGPGEEEGSRLVVRDLSMNGTGLKRPENDRPSHLDKNADAPLPHGSVILVPMMLKVSQEQAERAWLKVEYKETADEAAAAASNGVVKDISAEAPKTSSREKAAPEKVAPAPAEAPSPPSPPKAAANGGKDKDRSAEEPDEAQQDEDVEKTRMRFVELLLKTREVNASTTYAQAEKMLSSSPDWHAVDDATRKECFDIFVEHLGSHSQKKDKKDKKNKDKEKSKKHKKEPERPAPQRESGGGADEANKEKKRRDRRASASRDGSPDRRRKGEKRRRARSKSPRARSAGSAGSPPPREKHRRRNRNSSP